MSKISVALCTFNGAHFIKKQLESILAQTRSIDELVVCDDISTDETLAILAEVIRDAPFTTHVEINDTRLGSTKNFEKAIQRCTGEIIFLCDQDDEWTPEKVSKQLAFLDENPDLDAVFTDALIIDENSQTNGDQLWAKIEFDNNCKQIWQSGRGCELLFGGYVVTGATLAIRRSALPKLLPFPVINKQLIHDGWIALMLSLDNKIQFIDACLLRYRVHKKQQVGLGQPQPMVTLIDRFTRPRAEKLEPIQLKADYLRQLYELLNARQFIDRESLGKLKEMKRHYNVRANLPANRIARIRLIWQEWQQKRYKYSSKDWWRPLWGDLLE